jgi:curli production assembly/transport component CsgE
MGKISKLYDSSWTIFFMYLRYFLALVVFTALSLNSIAQEEKVLSDSVRNRTQEYLQRALSEAAKKVGQQDEMLLDLEIDEILVNETLSKPGNDFFDMFYNAFVWPDVPGDYIVTISERPFRLTTTLVEIRVNDLEVFSNFLQPRSSFLEELVNYATEVTRQYIINYNAIIQELGGEDMGGTGIY